MYPDTSADAVMEQLEPFQQRLVAIFQTAVAKFNSIPPELLLPLVRWNRSRSTCIWAFAMAELEQAFAAETGVVLVVKYESIEIRFNANLIARLKKMAATGFTTNYPTGRVKDYHNENQGELFALQWAKPVRVDIGYLPNETGTAVERVMVAKRRSHRVMHWTRPIELPETGTPIPLEKRPVTPLPSTGETRIEARVSDENTKQEPTGTTQ